MNLKILSFIYCFIAVTQAWAAPQAHISHQGDTVHLEFTGRPQWDYVLEKLDKKNQSLVQLTIEKLDEKSEKSLRAFSSPLVKSIQIDPSGPDGKNVITFQMADSDVEPFDYLTEKPSRLIIDLFKNSTAETSESAPEKKKAATKSVDKSKKEAILKNTDAKNLKPAVGRTPASDLLLINDQGGQDASAVMAEESKARPGAIFDGGDPNFERFSIKDYEIKENAVIASRENIYIDFPMVRLPSPYLEILQSRKPVYEITPQDTEENKQARLLLTLFENKRYYVFLKTVDWFLKEYPSSQYDEMVRFMWADALFAIWNENRNVDDFDMAMIRYRQAIEKYPQSPLLERTMMLMGFATLDRGDYLGTLRLFQTHLQKRPQSPNKDIARFAIADAFLKINRYDEAAQVYNEIEKDAIQEKDKVRAAYMKGDVHFQKKDYHAAIQEYQAAEKNFPKSGSEYPNAVYNQAAAYFGLKDYRKSLALYEKFLKEFPSHSDAGYAMTRVGEILDILGADKTRVLGAYLETYFRYGDAPSATIARLRMLSERMNAMKPKEVEKAIQDIQELAKDSKLPKMSQFATMMITEGLNRRKEYGKAVEMLVKYYQDNPTSVDTKLVTSRIVKNINEDLENLVNQGKFLAALKLHDQYKGTWLKSSNRIDTKFNIGRAFEQSGVTKEAEKLYQDTLNQIYAIKGTAAGKERNVFEHLPSADQVSLRLAAVQVQQGQYSKAYDALKNIQNPQNLSEREQVERVQMASNLLDQRGETESAIRYLTELLKEWSGIPELVADPYLHLAQLEIKLNRVDDAITSLQKIGTLMEDSKKVSPTTHARSLEMLGDLQVKRGLKDEAIGTYEKLLTNYENSRPLASYRYRMGQLYFDRGEIKKAAQVWQELKDEKNDFWSKMAQEQLKGAEWKDEYNKYIQRIPAMSEAGSGTERK